jgi:peptidoglycan/xylan/chitin deacetylase (PgdA/CDA1 family)
MFNFKRLLIAIILIFVAFGLGFFIWIQNQYVVPILMYHSVSTKNTNPVNVLFHPQNVLLQLNVVSPKVFDRQMDFLKRNRYNVITLDEFVKGDVARKRFPHNTVVITFDDGYEDNYTDAYPILKKYHFPATIFLISDCVGKMPNLLTWDQIKEMSQNGISFGSHTRYHTYLPNVSKAQMRDEIVESKHVIEKNLGTPIYYFAYPIGGFNEQAKAIAALAGYKAAMTTNRGYDRYNIDTFELGRIHVNNWDSEISLKGKLSGYYNLFRALKPSH